MGYLHACTILPCTALHQLQRTQLGGSMLLWDVPAPKIISLDPLFSINHPGSGFNNNHRNSQQASSREGRPRSPNQSCMNLYVCCPSHNTCPLAHSPEPVAGLPGPGPAGRRLGVLSSSCLQNGTKEQLSMSIDPQEGIPWGQDSTAQGWDSPSLPAS